MPKTRIAIVALTLFLAVGASAQAEIKRGDAGPNTFSGTPHRDWYWGYGGDDTLFGRAATDYLYGGGDNDTIVAGRGADFAYGGDGADEIALRRVQTADSNAWASASKPVCTATESGCVSVKSGSRIAMRARALGSPQAIFSWVSSRLTRAYDWHSLPVPEVVGIAMNGSIGFGALP